MSQLIERLVRENFAKGRPHVPLCLRADAYTISSEAFAAPVARDRSVYSLTNRLSPAASLPDLCVDSRMIFYGLSNFIQNVLTRPITQDDVVKSAEFMKRAHAFGGGLPFPERLWMQVVEDYNGFLPIKIEALPEGTTFFPNEPYIQITSLDKGFGEIAAHLESRLVGQVATATARATIARHWLDRVEKEIKDDFPNMPDDEVKAQAQFFLHDFGARACSSDDETDNFGMAHLLSFHGTDTFSAAFRAWEGGAHPQTGTSILALAHRIIQGHGTDESAFNRLRDVAGQYGDVCIGSYLGDCYNWEYALNNIIARMAKEANEDKSKDIFVVRPDSADPVKCVLQVVEKAVELGLFAEKEGKKIATTVRYIQGDSINPKKFFRILYAIAQYASCAKTQWGGYGVGGWAVNNSTRDVFSTAYKMTSKGFASIPVVKLSETPAKLSVPGPNIILRGEKGQRTVQIASREGDDGGNLYQTFYHGGQQGDAKFRPACYENFSTLQDRAYNSFKEAALIYGPQYGTSADTCLSEEIVKIQTETFNRHRKVEVEVSE